jgi:hypothetical protein
LLQAIVKGYNENSNDLKNGYVTLLGPVCFIPTILHALSIAAFSKDRISLLPNKDAKELEEFKTTYNMLPNLHSLKLSLLDVSIT